MDPQVYKVGLTTFSSFVPLTPTQLKKINDQSVLLNIDGGNYQKNKWNQVMHKITSIETAVVFIANNQYEPILRQMSQISFPRLIRLMAQKNSIVSIECLIKYDWPLLKELDLSHNFIVSAKSFAKMSCKNLETLNLRYNPLVNLQDFFKADFDKIQKIGLSSQEQLQSVSKINMSYDPFTWMVKLKRNITQRLNPGWGFYYLNKDRIYIHYKNQLRQKANLPKFFYRFHPQGMEMYQINPNYSDQDNQVSDDQVQEDY